METSFQDSSAPAIEMVILACGLAVANDVVTVDMFRLWQHSFFRNRSNPKPPMRLASAVLG